MQAEYQSKTIYVTHVSQDKSYVIASYNEDKSKQFKVDTKDLTNIDQTLKAELEKKGH
jgi:hypothetical protein